MGKVIVAEQCRAPRRRQRGEVALQIIAPHDAFAIGARLDEHAAGGVARKARRLPERIGHAPEVPVRAVALLPEPPAALDAHKPARHVMGQSS